KLARPRPLTAPGAPSAHIARALLRADSRHRIALLQSLVSINQSHGRMTTSVRSNHLSLSPLVPDGHPLRRLVGRAAIRAGTSAYHQHPARQGTMNPERSACVLHDTQDPDVLMGTSPSTRP